MDWQESRIADLESQDVAQTARRYDSELQSMKLQLQQERQRLEAQLQQEKRAREVAETQLHSHATMAHSSKGSGPNSGNLGSPRKGRENSSPNKPRGSSSLQESVVLKAQLQQARDAAERDSAHWRAALEDERHTCEKLRQQLNQLEESDQLVATAAANSQQQVHHLRQQLESREDPGSHAGCEPAGGSAQRAQQQDVQTAAAVALHSRPRQRQDGRRPCG